MKHMKQVVNQSSTSPNSHVRVRRAFWSRWPVRILVGLLAGMFFLFIGIPLASLLLRESPALVWSEILQPDVLQALQLSLLTTTLSALVVILFGLPVAYVLACVDFPGRKV